MKKITLLFSLTFLLSLSAFPAQKIRNPAKAGQWYSDNGKILSAQLEKYLKNVKEDITLPGDVIAVISPHAGYPCSGQVAAYSYRLVKGKGYKTVIIIAPSHTLYFNGCSIYPQGGYRTPLGIAEIDSALATDLIKASGFSFIPQAHHEEHAVEIQVPFIQLVLPEAKIVPVVMGTPEEKTIRTLATALDKVIKDKKVLIVASTDMSHYLPQKKANSTDRNTISLISAFKIETLIRKVEKHENIMCGGGPVVATLLYALKRGKPKVTILKYGDSSVCAKPSRVVGYLSAAISLEKKPEFVLTDEDKKELLSLARAAIATYARKRKILDYNNNNPRFEVKKGAFVTLRSGDAFRGCIGLIEPIFPLYQAVIRAAISAAYADPRTPPVSPEEVENLEIEISVLTPPKKITDPQLVKVGKHGLIISKRGKKGLLLPQVAVENHWTRKQFLEACCLKAGLAKNEWRKGAEISIFEAIVFH
ncbi:MAG: AmmeMemoRadiSam system protein B [Candidatus Aminicenantales bacterium]